MNIKPVVYEHLTPRQRVAVAIEALARGDYAEHEKLNATCPQKHYKQADYKYSGVLQALMALAVANEHSLTGDALSMMTCWYADADNMDEVAGKFLQNISDHYEAWNAALEYMGIDPEAMTKLAKPIRHPVVSHLLTMELPEPDFETVQKIKTGHEDFLKKLQSV